MNGLGNLISSVADIDFFRVMPPAGYTKGMPAERRTDVGEGAIAPETRSKDFFAYKPFHLGESPPPSKPGGWSPAKSQWVETLHTLIW
jgi:L-asparaginase